MAFDCAVHPHTTRPLKVCFISPLGYELYHPGSGLPFGGAEVQFFLLANTLAGDPAYQVSVLTTVDREPGVETFRGLTVYRRRGRGRLDQLPRPGLFETVRAASRYLTAFYDMYRQFRRVDADVYLHAGAGVEVGAYALICRLLRRRFLFFIASSADLWEPYGKVGGALKWLFPLGIRLADGVVCRSSEQQQRLQERYGRHGVLIRTGHHRPTDRSEVKTSILWVGRGIPLKQPEMFLDLVARLPDYPCVMVMTSEAGHEDLGRRIRQRAQTLPNLQLHERVPFHAMDQHFTRAKVFVNTSTYEGFPNTFVQAAMHGAPVVSWRVDPDKLLSHETIGLCANASFDRLFELVRDLCSTEGARAALGRRAQEYAYAHHSVEQSAAELNAYVRSRIAQ